MRAGAANAQAGKQGKKERTEQKLATEQMSRKKGHRRSVVCMGAAAATTMIEGEPNVGSRNEKITHPQSRVSTCEAVFSVMTFKGVHARNPCAYSRGRSVSQCGGATTPLCCMCVSLVCSEAVCSVLRSEVCIRVLFAFFVSDRARTSLEEVV